MSFGPFHLGKLAKTELDEIKTKVVREQLGLVLQSTTPASQRKTRARSPVSRAVFVAGGDEDGCKFEAKSQAAESQAPQSPAPQSSAEAIRNAAAGRYVGTGGAGGSAPRQAAFAG